MTYEELYDYLSEQYDKFNDALHEAICRLNWQQANEGKRTYTKVWGLEWLSGLSIQGTLEQIEYILANYEKLIKFCERKERSRSCLILHINKQLAKARERAGA